MAQLYSLAEAAAQLGVHKSTVSRACTAHGIGTRIGNIVALTPAEVSRLRKLIPGKVGNPNFTPGNYYGGTKKRPRNKG